MAPEVAALHQRGRFGARRWVGFQFQNGDVTLGVPADHPRGQTLARCPEGEVQGDPAGRRFRRIVGQAEGAGYHVGAGEHLPPSHQEA